MRVPAVLLVLLLAAVGSPSESRAEKVKSNQSMGLLSRPGERGKVLLKVPEGQVMTVIAKDGRWLKVRVMRRTGWVPRSKVDVSGEIARNTRRRPFVDGRGTGRGFGGEEGPEDRIGADAIGDGVEPNLGDDEEGDAKGAKDGAKGAKDGAKDGAKGAKDGGKGAKGGGEDGGEDDEGGEGGEGDDSDTVVIDEEPSEARATARVKSKLVALAEPSEDADESFDATPQMVLYPTGNTKGKYTEVENDEGDLGYVLTASLEIEEPEGVLEDGTDGGPRKRQIDGRARFGVTLFSQAANGGGKVSASAVTFAFGGTYLRPAKEKYLLGGEATYDYARAIPGIRNPGGGTTGISLHNLRLRALGGYDMKKPNGMTLFGRLGLHYQSYQVADVADLTKNKALLPSEIITAPALGFGIAIPRLTKKIGLRASLDAILFSSVKQTVNLEDGQSPGASGALLEAGMTYRWKKNLDLLATYDLTYFSMSFGAAKPGSKRPAVMGNASRGDLFHAVTFGAGRAF